MLQFSLLYISQYKLCLNYSYSLPSFLLLQIKHNLRKIPLLFTFKLCCYPSYPFFSSSGFQISTPISSNPHKAKTTFLEHICIALTSIHFQSLWCLPFPPAQFQISWTDHQYSVMLSFPGLQFSNTFFLSTVPVNLYLSICQCFMQVPSQLFSHTIPNANLPSET